MSIQGNESNQEVETLIEADDTGEAGEQESQELAVESKEAALGIVSQFLLTLQDFCQALEIKQNFRILKDGFFVSEALSEKVLSEFALFYAREANVSATVDAKTVKKLYGHEFPSLYYLVEGKTCIAGFLVPHTVTGLEKVVPAFRGSLIDARDMLHPRDPVLGAIEGVKIKFDNTGFGVHIPLKDKKIFVDSPVLSRFQKSLCGSTKLRIKYPDATRSLRAALVPLTRLLKNARLLGKKNFLVIPSKYRKDPTIAFYKVGSFIFVIRSSEKLEDCFELRGKNLRFFVNAELDTLRGSKKSRIGCFQLSRKPGAIVGAFMTPDGEKNLLHMKAFLEGLELVFRRRTLRKSLPVQATLYDFIKVLSEVLKASIRIEAHEVPHNILQGYLNSSKKSKRSNDKHRKNKPQKPIEASDLRYRSGKGWIFFIHNKNTIQGIAEKPVIHKK